MDGKGIGLRERTRRAVAGELQAVAMDLFLSQGFEATTVDQIATAAGLSRRSFFRYFASKDDVLAQALRTTGETIAQTLSARPASESVWAATRRAFDPLITAVTSEPRALAMTRMMLESSALQASHEQKQTSWRAAIADALEPRLTEDPIGTERRLKADALSGAALACLTSAQAEWVRQDGQQPLGGLLDIAMCAVRPIHS